MPHRRLLSHCLLTHLIVSTRSFTNQMRWNRIRLAAKLGGLRTPLVNAVKVTSARLKELGEIIVQNFSNNFRNTTSKGIQSWQALN
jgi:hypothetical protein